ncbi:possible ABC transport system periplasmic substrate-binding protein [Hydrogenimonas sp.]|nr:possible ABC transport system periplasmic substrate-binding protein [Hydrogenimonas sp.]
MESKASYTIVGLFVFLLGAGAVAFALWMGKYNSKKEFAYYYTYMKESVAGLPPDGAVKYMGVNIGKVKEIHIDPDDPTRVRLLLQIPKDIPIREGMYATLNFTGITGIAYIEIIGGKKGAPLIKSEPGKIPVIPSKPSTLAQIGTSVSDLAVQISKALDRLNNAFSEENMKHFNSMMRNLDLSSRSLNRILSAENAESIDTLLHNLAEASEKSDKLFEAVDAIKSTTLSLGTEANRTLASLKESAESFKRVNNALMKRIEEGDLNIRQLLQQTLAQSKALMRASQALIYQLEEDALMIKNSPRDLFFKEAEPALGPGEEKR